MTSRKAGARPDPGPIPAGIYAALSASLAINGVDDPAGAVFITVEGAAPIPLAGAIALFCAALALSTPSPWLTGQAEARQLIRISRPFRPDCPEFRRVRRQHVRIARHNCMISPYVPGDWPVSRSARAGAMER